MVDLIKMMMLRPKQYMYATNNQCVYWRTNQHMRLP